MLAMRTRITSPCGRSEAKGITPFCTPVVAEVFLRATPTAMFPSRYSVTPLEGRTT